MKLTKEEDLKMRNMQNIITSRLFESLEINSNKIINEIKKKSNNDEAKKFLDYSLNDLKEIVEYLNEYSTKIESREQFSDFIKDVYSKVFKYLKKAIINELGLMIGDGTTIEKFFEDFFNYLNYKNMIKIAPRSELLRNVISKESFFRRMTSDEFNQYKSIYTFLENKGENNPAGYTKLSSFLTCIRNISEHKPNCIKNDFLYDSVDDYGNFYIASNIIFLLSYAYIEIIERWNNFLY